MRELKFRVYIPDHGRFSHFELGDFWHSDRYLHQYSYPVQQYVGEVDSNKVEIYEGDIVSIDDKFNFGDDHPRLHEVVFTNLRGTPGIQGFQLKNKHDRLCRWIWTSLTVVGNIIENPDLLNEI